MKKTILVAAVCAAGFLAGCGSSAKTTASPTATTTTSAPGATTGESTGTTASNTGMTVGSSGTMGPPQGGSPYDLRNNTVLKHLLHMIDVAIAAKGNTNVRGVCKAVSSTQAECGVEFTTPQGKVAKVLYTLNVNLQTGHFTVSDVRPLS
jgi:hypothetical protein